MSKRKLKYGTFALIILIIVLFLSSNFFAQKKLNYIVYRGQLKMKNKDYLAGLGYFEKSLDIDSTSVRAHLEAAYALDSLKRPIEAGWHYGYAKKYQSWHKK